MSEIQIYTLTGLGLYFLFLILIGARDALKDDHQGFVIGNRDVGLLPTLSSVTAGYRDGSGIIFFVGASLTIGYAGFWYFLLATCSLFVFGQIAGRYRKLAREKEYITIGEVVRGEIGHFSEKTVSFVILAFSLLYIMVQLYVSGNLFSRLLDLPEIMGVALVGSVVALYLFFGGYGTVIRTDFLQFFIILAMALIPFYIKPDWENFSDFSSFMSADLSIIIGLCIMGIFTPFSSADIWQRVFSARDDKVIKYAFPLSGVFLAFMTLTLIAIGMGIAKLFPDASPDELVFVLYQASENVDHIPTFILAFFAIGIMSITMSTLDTTCYVFSSTLAKNFFKDKISDTREHYMKFSRMVFLVIISVMCVMSLYIEDIIGTIISIITFIMILAPVYMLTASGLVKPSKSLDIFLSLSVAFSLAVYVTMFVMGLMGDLLLSNIPALCCATLCLSAIVVDRYMFQKQHV